MSKFRIRFTQLSMMVFTVIFVLSPNRVEAQQTKSSGPTGTISGHVLIGDSVARGLTVMLLSYSPTVIRAPGVHTKTDENGMYQFTGVGPGQYAVQPFAPALVGKGSILFTRTSNPINVANGDNVEGVDLILNQGGVITGRVIDADGHPLVQESVHLFGFINAMSKVPIYTNTYMFTTDDRGEYRLFGLAPGQYIVSVGYNKDDPVTGLNSPNTLCPLTYYPNTSEESKATKIEVVAGGEATGIDIVVGKPAAGFSVSGKIINSLTGKPIPGLLFGYKPVNIDNAPLSPAATTSNSLGEFRITGVLPGQYVAFAYPQANSDMYSDVASFTVSTGDVKGLVIQLHTGSTITGTIIIEGADPKTAASKLAELSLIVRPSSFNTVTQSTLLKISADGSFRAAGLPRGKANFSFVFPVPKGINLDHIELLGVPQKYGIEVGENQEISGVNVILSYGDGSIRGDARIEGGDRDAESHMNATVRMINNDVMDAFQRSVEVDHRGRFFFDGLPPGDYEITLYYQRGPNGDSSDISRPVMRVVKQTIKVTNGIETPVTLVVDLSDINR